LPGRAASQHAADTHGDQSNECDSYDAENNRTRKPEITTGNDATDTWDRHIRLTVATFHTPGNAPRAPRDPKRRRGNIARVRRPALTLRVIMGWDLWPKGRNRGHFQLLKRQYDRARQWAGLPFGSASATRHS
jgi:hypothetical protein